MEAEVGARIRAERQLRRLSLRELASRVGVSASMLSQVETGRCRASVSTLYRLVTELGLSLDDVCEIAPAETRDRGPVASLPNSRKVVEPRQRSPVLPAEDRVSIELESGVRWERLSNVGPENVEFILVTYRPGSSSAQSGKYQ